MFLKPKRSFGAPTLLSVIFNHAPTVVVTGVRGAFVLYTIRFGRVDECTYDRIDNKRIDTRIRIETLKYFDIRSAERARRAFERFRDESG